MSDTFLSYACDLFGDTNNGLSRLEIIKYCNKSVLEYNKEIAYSSLPKMIPKREILKENLNWFDFDEQIKIIYFLCCIDKFKNNEDVMKLRCELIKEYNEFLNSEEIDVRLFYS